MGDMLGDLGASLDKIAWADYGNAHRDAEKLFQGAWDRAPELFTALRTRLDELPAHVVTRAGELISWCLGQGDVYTLKLNQFVPDGMSGRRSLSIHNHTRPLTSLTLAGGYSSDEYTPVRSLSSYNEGDSFSMDELVGHPVPSTRPGLVHTIGPDTIHGLTDFQDGTLTLAVYGAFVRPEITLFNTVTRKVEVRRSYDSAKQGLMRQLDEASRQYLPR